MLILIDLQKAFDTIDHEILLQKMVHLQFSAQSIMWFRSYLTTEHFYLMWKKAFQIQGNLNAVSPRVLSWYLSCSFCMSMTCLEQSAAKCYCMLMIHALSSRPKTLIQFLRNSMRNLINFLLVCRQQTKHSFSG